jgi:transmembrane 9 superfamily protein 2/4
MYTKTAKITTNSQLSNCFLFRTMIWLFVIGIANGFYLPGLAPVSYCKIGEETETCQSRIELFVNRLTSTDSVIPFEYSAFDFCAADISKKSPSENLGQVLFGEVKF